jgi:hypothetical protein
MPTLPSLRGTLIKRIHVASNARQRRAAAV